MNTLYNTGPITFYASIDALNNQGLTSDSVFTSNGINIIDNFFHTSISDRLSDITHLGVIQDPPANDILITDSNGNSTGKTPTGKVVSNIPGSQYVTLENTSAIILTKPLEGKYQLSVTGESTGDFHLSLSIVDLTGNLTNLQVKEITYHDNILQDQTKNYMVDISNGGFENLFLLPDTTIKSAVVGNGIVLQNGSSTVYRSIAFNVQSIIGTNPIAGFQCSLDNTESQSCDATNSGIITYNNLVSGQQHIFQVRAIDTYGYTDPTPGTFIWKVLTPTQAIQKLVNTIDNMNLPKGTTTSMEAPLNNAIKQLGNNNNTPVCNNLGAFINQLNAKEDNGQLSTGQAADLRQQATGIQQALGC